MLSEVEEIKSESVEMNQEDPARLPVLSPRERIDICQSLISEKSQILRQLESGYNEWITTAVRGVLDSIVASTPNVYDKDPLVKAAMLEAQGKYQYGGRRHHCNCGSDATSFLNKTVSDGIRDLVVYQTPRRDCPFYEIPTEAFDEGRVRLINLFGSESIKSELNEKLTTIGIFRFDIVRAESELKRMRKSLMLDETAAKYGLSLDAAQHLIRAGFPSSVMSATPDIFAYVLDRSDHANSGGVAKYSDLYLYHHGATKLYSFQWRDRFNPDLDRPDQRIKRIKSCEIVSQNEEARELVITFTNGVDNDVQVSNSFKIESDRVNLASLCPSDAEEFKERANRVIEEVVKQKLDQRNRKPAFILPGGAYSYLEPEIKQVLIQDETGVAAFVTSEQIDHTLNRDRQMRYELYVLDADSLEPSVIYEDHAYMKREGRDGAIFLVGLDRRIVRFNTSEGIKEVPLNLM